MADPDLQAIEAESKPDRRDSIFGYLVDGMNSIGSLIIFAIMLLICADVLSRDLWNKPIAGVPELVGQSIIAIVFLQLASTLRHGRMSRAEIFIDGFREKRPRAGALLQAFFDACGVFVCLVIIYASWPRLVQAWTKNEFLGVEGVFTAPIWPVSLVVLLGAIATCLQFILICKSNVAAAFEVSAQARSN